MKKVVADVLGVLEGAWYTAKVREHPLVWMANWEVRLYECKRLVAATLDVFATDGNDYMGTVTWWERDLKTRHIPVFHSLVVDEGWKLITPLFRELEEERAVR